MQAWFSWCTGVWRQVSGGQRNKRGWSVLSCQWASCVLSLILMQSGGSYFLDVSNLSMDTVWNTPLIVWSAVLHSAPGSFNGAVNVPWIPNVSSIDNDKVLLADHHHILIKKKTNCDLKFTFTKADFIVYPVTMIYEEEGHMWESVYPQQLTKINPYEQNSSVLLPGMEIENLHHRGQVPNCPTGVLSPEFVGMCFSCALQNNNVKPVLETYNKTVTAERTERSKCGFISQRQVTVLVVNLQKIKIQTKKL